MNEKQTAFWKHHNFEKFLPVLDEMNISYATD